MGGGACYACYKVAKTGQETDKSVSKPIHISLCPTFCLQLSKFQDFGDVFGDLLPNIFMLHKSGKFIHLKQIVLEASADAQIYSMLYDKVKF